MPPVREDDRVSRPKGSLWGGGELFRGGEGVRFGAGEVDLGDSRCMCVEEDREDREEERGRLR